jgi:hypothetical protein
MLTMPLKDETAEAKRNEELQCSSRPFFQDIHHV